MHLAGVRRMADFHLWVSPQKARKFVLTRFNE
jgi:hypothetical protein